MSTSRLGVDEQHLKTCVKQHLKTCVDEHLKTCVEQHLKTCVEQHLKTCVEQHLKTCVEQHLKTCVEQHLNGPAECNAAVQTAQSEGGTIYVGLSKDGQVKGLPLTCDCRDRVRLHVDEMVSRVEPAVTFNQLAVSFVQIARRSINGNLELSGNLFVIEIHVKPPDEIRFVTRNKTCFQRKGPVNHILTEQDVEEQVAAHEESKYLLELKSLRQRCTQLIQESW
ncbi:hypothetical protein ACOMHN_004701 [Nucella lapillus]